MRHLHKKKNVLLISFSFQANKMNVEYLTMSVENVLEMKRVGTFDLQFFIIVVVHIGGNRRE